MIKDYIYSNLAYHKATLSKVALYAPFVRFINMTLYETKIILE